MKTLLPDYMPTIKFDQCNLGALFCLAYPGRWFFVVAIVIGSAIGLELAQLLTPDRHGELIDALQKMTGGTFGILLILVLRRSKWIRL